MRIGDGVKTLVSQLACGGDAAAKAARAAQVNAAWEDSVRAVYKQGADFVLSHVNAVYVMAADAKVKGARPDAPDAPAPSGAQLVVYADDSLVRSDIDARQEFLKMQLRARGELVGTFRILPSRFDMKARHPFVRPRTGVGAASGSVDPRATVTQEAFDSLMNKARALEDPAVRRSLEKALNANLNRKN